MRRSIIATLFLVFVSIGFSSAQSWMNDSLSWKETRNFNFGPTSSINYTTAMQETINDTLYQQIRQTTCLNDGALDEFICHLRSENNKVFARIEDEEFLLYDFTLEVGEMYQPRLCEGIFDVDDPSYIYVVTNVSTVLINDQERRVITLMSESFPMPTQIWTEGIGSNLGLFLGVEWCSIDYFSEMTCFERNLELEYTSPNFEICCPIALSDGDDNYPSTKENVLYPNPISTSQSMRFKDGFESGRLTVYSQEGRMVVSVEFSKTSVFTPGDLGLSTGMYHILIEAEQNRAHQKLIVR